MRSPPRITTVTCDPPENEGNFSPVSLRSVNRLTKGVASSIAETNTWMLSTVFIEIPREIRGHRHDPGTDAFARLEPTTSNNLANLKIDAIHESGSVPLTR